jgi:hypothetical protein
MARRGLVTYITGPNFIVFSSDYLPISKIQRY